jgi:hypothetical protein
MAYYIFLKSLRSLEEFRKNHHVKIPPKSPFTNFQSLGKFKNPIFNLEILFPCFRPTRPSAQPAPAGLSSPAGRSPQAGPSRLARACRWRNCRSVLSPLIHAFHLGAFSLSSVDAWVPRVSPIFPTAPADPGQKSSTPPLPPRRRSAPRMPPSLYSPPHHSSPLIPFKLSHNEP